MIQELLIIGTLISICNGAETNCATGKTLIGESLCFTDDYSSTRPNFPNHEIRIFFKDINIFDIDLKKQAISISFEYRIRWKDNRISLASGIDVPVLATEQFYKVWTPRLKMPNLIGTTTYSILGKMDKLVVFPNEEILFATIERFEVACAMEFEKFPFDHQICNVTFENQLQKYAPMKLINDGIDYDNNNERLQQYFIKVLAFNDTDNTAVGMTFHLHRYSVPFIFKYYLPSFALIILTSLSFFIPPKLVPGRGGMLVMLFLVLNNIYATSKDETPISRKATQMTEYIFVCIVFSFLAIMYYGALLYVDRNPEKVKPIIAKSEKPDPYFKMDRICFGIYISTFFLFNVVTVVKYVDKIM